MDFVLIANAWSAGRDNPTSKHRIALELTDRGHRVLWIEGAGMRRPSLTSGSDRGRILRKLKACLRGARRVERGTWNAERRMGLDGDGSTESKPRGSGELWVLSPLLLPLPAFGWVRVFNGWLFAATAKAWSGRLDFSEPVLINYVPVLAEAMRHWKRVPRSAFRIPRSVYHCVDRWDAFDMYDSRMMADMDHRCCRYADLVIASSRDLYERCRAINANTHLVTHGVDHAHFAKALALRSQESRLRSASYGGQAGVRSRENGRPVDLPDGRIVGFFGLLSEWLDQDLVVALARQLKAESGMRNAEGKRAAPGREASVVLIGAADVDVTRLEQEPNIHLLGPKAFVELPDYIGHFDVGIIPFVVNDLTKAVNPIKLREMIAAGCPVVSTTLPEVEAHAERGTARGVEIGRTGDAFIRRVLLRLASPLSSEERVALSDSVRFESWEVKVDEILRVAENASS